MTQEKLIGGRYRLSKKLGRRSLGDSFAAIDVQLNRPVILESLQGPVLTSPEARLPMETILGVKHDLEKLAQIQSPYLLNVLEVQAAGSPPFLVFEPLTGEPLASWFPKQRLRGKALEETLEKVTRDLLEALDSLHGAGLVHKDIRPATIFRAESGDFLLTEPGLLRAPGVDEVLHPSVVAQTDPFQAPEVLLGNPASAASDLYQLGGVLRFLATGRPPWANPEAAFQAARGKQALPGMAQQVPGLREAWCIFLDELQALDPTQRIASVAAANEFQDMMLAEEAAQEAGLTPGFPGQGQGPGLPPPPTPENVSRIRPLLPGFLVLGILGGLYLTMPAKVPLPSLTTEVLVGIESLRVTWTPDGKVPIEGPLTLKIKEQEDRPLEETEGHFQLQLSCSEATGQGYKLVDAKGHTLAADQFPTGLSEFRQVLRTSYQPDGSVQITLDGNREVGLKTYFNQAGKAQIVASKAPARHHQVVLKPGWDQGVSQIRLEVTGPLGKQVWFKHGPKELIAHRPFFKKALKALNSLVPKAVTTQLREALKQAKDHAVTIEVTGWDAVLKKWQEDPDFQRLQGHGDFLFGAREKLGEERLFSAYDSFLSLERVNTAIVAVTLQEPLSIRKVFRAYCHHFVPKEARGSRALAPGTGGPIMMQYSRPKPSWLNEDGKKTWPNSFETPFALPPSFYTPGAKARFTAVVEDVSPLYRMELMLSFRVKGEEFQRSFWFYPRRNMQRLATKKDPAQALMALEVPVAILPREIGTLTLEIDRLGYWGGHGATSFVELKLEKIEPDSAPTPK
jgi:serine/threonine protein kinase